MAEWKSFTEQTCLHCNFVKSLAHGNCDACGSAPQFGRKPLAFFIISKIMSRVVGSRNMFITLKVWLYETKLSLSPIKSLVTCFRTTNQKRANDTTFYYAKKKSEPHHCWVRFGDFGIYNWRYNAHLINKCKYLRLSELVCIRNYIH